MTEEQAIVFEAMGNGRLIFPQMSEMKELRGINGPRTSQESGRLAVLEKAFSKISEKDRAFHSALEHGNVSGADAIAQAALKIIEDAG